MNKQSIILYIRMQGGTEIPALQQQFGLSYRVAKDLVDELVKEDKLSFQHGVHYVYNEKSPDDCEDNGMQNTVIPDEKAEDYFEKRRTELIRRLREEYDNFYDDSDDEYEDDYDDGDETIDGGADDDEDVDPSVINQAMLANIRESTARRLPLNKKLQQTVMDEKVRISKATEQTLHNVSITLHDFNRKLERFSLPQRRLWQSLDDLEMCAMDRLAYIVENDENITLSLARGEAIKMRVSLEGKQSKALEACRLLEYYLNQCSDQGFAVVVRQIIKQSK